MDQKFRAGMSCALRVDVLRIDARMHVTLAHPDVHVLPPGHSAHVRAEEHVGKKENLLVGRNRVHDLDRVARRAAIVALRLHLGRRVDVTDHDRARMLGLPIPQLVRVDRRRERAARRQVRQQDRFAGERIAAVSAMKCTPQKTMTSRVGLRGFAAQAERVADEIGDVLHLGALVVVREDDRVAFAGKFLDACNDAPRRAQFCIWIQS